MGAARVCPSPVDGVGFYPPRFTARSSAPLGQAAEPSSGTQLSQVQGEACAVQILPRATWPVRVRAGHACVSNSGAGLRVRSPGGVSAPFSSVTAHRLDALKMHGSGPTVCMGLGAVQSVHGSGPQCAWGRVPESRQLFRLLSV